jgi:hypothetical protein
VPVEHPLTAAIHAAGAPDDAVFRAQTLRHLYVLRPKVDAGGTCTNLPRARIYRRSCCFRR